VTPEAEPFNLFGEWLAAAETHRVQRSQRHGAGDGRCRRSATYGCCSRTSTTDGFVFFTNGDRRRAANSAENLRRSGAALEERSAGRSGSGLVEGSPRPRPTRIRVPRPDSRIGAGPAASPPLADRW